MKLSIERFSAIVDAYGCDPQRWPAPERQAASALLATSAQAQALYAQAEQLDQMLNAQPSPDFEQLLQRLQQQTLPHPVGPGASTVLERLLCWFLPSGASLSQWWRPTVLACVPLMLGLLIGGQFEAVPEQYVTGGLEEELYFISLSDYAEML